MLAVTHQGLSGNRLHQAATGIGIVVVVLGVVLPKGIDAESSSANEASEEAHGSCIADWIDELTHDNPSNPPDCNEELRNVSGSSHF